MDESLEEAMRLVVDQAVQDGALVRRLHPRAVLEANNDLLPYARWQVMTEPGSVFCVGSGNLPSEAWRNAAIHAAPLLALRSS
jgi:hypothetical protein